MRESQNAKAVDDELRRSMEVDSLQPGGSDVAESKDVPQTEEVREGKGGEDVDVTQRVQSVTLSDPVAESKSDAPTITTFDTPSSPAPAAKGVGEEPMSLASPTADPSTPVSEAKKKSPSSASNDNRKQVRGRERAMYRALYGGIGF